MVLLIGFSSKALFSHHAQHNMATRGGIVPMWPLALLEPPSPPRVPSALHCDGLTYYSAPHSLNPTGYFVIWRRRRRRAGDGWFARLNQQLRPTDRKKLDL